MKRAVVLMLICVLLAGSFSACGKKTAQPETEPAENTASVPTYDPHKLFGVLDYTKVWTITDKAAQISFLFEDDGTVYLCIAENGDVHSAGRGRYILSENTIDVSVLLNGQEELEFTYTFDAGTMSFRQESGEGVLALHSKGQSFPVTESSDPDAEKIRENADLLSAADAPNPNVEPYEEKVKNPKQPIFAGPGYQYEQVDTVREAGEYTIIEERDDYLGNLWGRLKSGAGWIDLTAVRTPKKSESPISLHYGNRSDLETSEFGCVVDSSAYSFVALFTANETVTDFALYDLDYDFVAGKRQYYVEEVPAGSQVAALVSLPGDFSIMGITFVDAYGAARRFYFYISGLDGSLKLVAY